MSTQTPVLRSLLLVPQDVTVFGNGHSRLRQGSATVDRVSPNPKLGSLYKSLETDTVEMKAKMERCLYEPPGNRQVSVTIRPRMIPSSSLRKNQPTDTRPSLVNSLTDNATCC